MTLVVVLLVAVCVGLPLWYAWRLWRLDAPSRGEWLSAALEAAVILALVLLLGRWDIAGLYTRIPLVALVAAALVLSWRRHRGRPWRTAPSAAVTKAAGAVRLASLALLAAALAWVGWGALPPAAPRDLAFPLDGGRFVVGQGGGIALLNHHASHAEQRHATDIGAVGPLGFRAPRLLPADPARYAVWDAPVLAPCAGTVVDVRGDLPDLPPPEADPENPAGNHVELDCAGIRVILAHLRQGSIVVAPGDTVAPGTPLGRVANSGNTTEPHLHVHAYDPATGQGVPVAFDGRHRNRVWLR